MYFNRKNAEQKNWRMIKKGKHFLFGCSLVFAVGATLATPTVHADTAEAKAEVTAGTTQAKPSAEVPTYASPAVTSPAETAPVEANSATTAVSADKSQLEAVLAQAKAKNLDGQEASVKAEVAAAIAEAEALVANGTASQEQVNQSVERLTQALASVKEVTEVAAETTTEATTESSATPKVRSKRATTEGTTRSVDETRLDRVTVTKDNFDSFFKEGGTANYDETSGTIKLTDDVSGQVGSAYLRFKIDPKEDFTFTGKVDIGNKYEGHEVDRRAGGDGVGFVFHTGNVDTIGQSGASIGMGTIKNAFGFKLDSWHNTSNPNANQNAPADPKYGGNAWRSNAFGAFYSSNAAGRVTTVGDAKALNPNPNGQWVDFKIEYKGQTKEFIVTYGSEKWSTNLKTANASTIAPNAKTALNNSNATYALSFLGSTGSGTNLQRVQIETFEFTAPQIVQVAFYDESGKEIAASSAIPGDRDQVINLNSVEAVQKAISKLEAKGYTLKEVNSKKAETYNAGANTVTLRSGGQLLKYVFKVKDTTPPAAPTVNPVTAGATAITGTAEAGSTVEVTLPGGTKASAKADQDGNFSVPVSALKEGDKVSVTATDDAGNKSTPTSATVPDTTAPAAPTVNPVTAGATAITGTAEAGSTVEVTLPGGTKASAKADQDGNFSVPVSALKEGDKVSVTATDDAGNKSTPTSATVPDTTAPAAPTVNPVTAGATAITGTAEPGSTVEVTLPNGSKASAKAEQDGSYSVPVSGLEEGKTVSVTATDAAGNKSTPTSVTVPDTTAPAAPTVNPVKAGATAITGTAEAGATVEVTLPGGQKVSAKAGDNGEFSIPVSALNADDQISVTATDAANNTSAPTKVIVKETVRPVLNIPYDDADAQAIYVYSGETNNIELKVTDNSGKIVKAYLAMPADNRTGLGQEDNTYLNGKTRSGLYLNADKIKTETTATEASPAVIHVTGDIPKNTYTDGTGLTRYLFAEDAAGNTSYEHVGANMDKGALGRIRFIWKPQSFKYTAVAPSTPITSNTVPEASVLEKAVKDANPTFSDKIESVSVDGTNVKVTYKDGSTDLIPTNSVFTIEPTAPTVTPVKNPSSLEQPEKDAVKKAVETANPSATKVEVGQDGTTTLTYSNGSTATLKPAQTVSQADVTAPDAPVVNPVKAGDTAVTGTAEAGSTVEVTLPDGTKATATADKDGNFSVPVSGLEEGQTVSVTAKDASNNTSTPTTATVAKA
ncbi:Ig-like domain-containing protein, partial [Streptococcus infantis]|uniref:Ig-like domain-containing protein n=1 Tax=Streptococcus infantis TaxID=68892 RepID=UPI0039C17018